MVKWAVLEVRVSLFDSLPIDQLVILTDTISDRRLGTNEMAITIVMAIEALDLKFY